VIEADEVLVLAYPFPSLATHTDIHTVALRRTLDVRWVFAHMAAPTGSSPSARNHMSTSIPLGRYRHFKGNEYEVLHLAKHSESGADMVVYRALYGEHGIWVRPLEMFIETVEQDGRRVPRFRFVG
jgi:hypothetical protein